MYDFDMAALMFRTGHGIRARPHSPAEIGHFPNWCIIRAREARGRRASAFQALMMHLVGKCVISAQAWVLAIFTHSLR